VSVATGARGRKEGENQHEWGRRRGRSRRRLPLRHAGGKHVIGVAQAVVEERGQEGGAPPQAAPVLERARGTACTLDDGAGQGAWRSEPQAYEVSSRAPEVRHEPRVTPLQPQCTPPAVTRAPSTHPLAIRSAHGVAPNDRLGGKGAHRTQDATHSDHGPADPSPHRIRLPPEIF